MEIEIKTILDNIHTYGPINQHELEILAHAKYFHPELFRKYENKLLCFMGLFYKNNNPETFIEVIYQNFLRAIESDTGSRFTPIQADAFNMIRRYENFSFSAPTSSGKSFLFQKLILDSGKDVIIVVPTRALLAEYLEKVQKIVDKSVLVLPFVDIINTKKTSRNIFILTPERGEEVFKFLNKIDLDFILLDEAQLTEDGLRGLKFDSFIRRLNIKLPNIKKIFTHPFVSNPEAQLIKHKLGNNKGVSKAYTQSTVGKIFLYHTDKKFIYFSPYNGKFNQFQSKSDIVEDVLNAEGAALFYISKSKIYNNEFLSDFSKYIDLCKPLVERQALELIEELRDYLGARDGRSLMIDLMTKGIVLHHGSIPLTARLLIEKFINLGFAKICFSTSTLIQGVNMPFDVVWIENYRFTGSDDKKILDLKNLIGRAGRSTVGNQDFDYGFVIIELRNKNNFVSRIQSDARLSDKSLLDEDIEVTEDFKDIVEAIKEDSFDVELNLTQKQVERISASNVDSDLKFVLDELFSETNTPITAHVFYTKSKKNRNKIFESIEKIYLSHMRRRELVEGERGVLNTAVLILLWIIQGKSFAEILSLRYSFITWKTEKEKLINRFKNNEINRTEYTAELHKMSFARYSAKAQSLPDKNFTHRVPLFGYYTKVGNVDFDIVLYDTYDYIDKVITFSLKDPLSASFLLYWEKSKDNRALAMSNYIRFGTNDNLEIWLLRYGFTFEDIEWLKEYVLSISEEEIVFNSDKLEELSETQYAKIERYL